MLGALLVMMLVISLMSSGVFASGGKAESSRPKPSRIPSATAVPSPSASASPSASSTPKPKPTTGNEQIDGNAESTDKGTPIYLSAETPAAQRQVDYILRYYQTWSPAYASMSKTDCVNFTSQSLIERGWAMDAEWWYNPRPDATKGQWSSPWISSTKFRDYLLAHPERATPLTDLQRDQVRIGDIVQFDWNRNGDRDHTAVVTKIAKFPDGSIEIFYGGHTDNTNYRSVDWAITVKHPGGKAYYFRVNG